MSDMRGGYKAVHIDDAIGKEATYCKVSGE